MDSIEKTLYTQLLKIKDEYEENEKCTNLVRYKYQKEELDKKFAKVYALILSYHVICQENKYKISNTMIECVRIGENLCFAYQIIPPFEYKIRSYLCTPKEKYQQRITDLQPLYL